MVLTRIIQWILFIIIPITCMIITPYALWSLPVPLFVIIFSFLKEYNYKSTYSEKPYLGKHFLLFRNIKKFDTIHGKFYYTYHLSCDDKDIIRMFRKKGLLYNLISYEVFNNNADKETVGDILKDLYVNGLNEENKESRFDLKVEFIGTDEEITSLKRKENLKTILGDG